MAHLLRDTDAMTITIGSPELINGREGRRVLAAFYGELLGWHEFEPYGWLKLTREPPNSPLQFALDGDGWSDARPPRWPDPEHPQQLHLDLFVPDLDAAGQRVRELGATPLADQDRFRVFADPAGHPFCLYPAAVAAVRVGRLVIDCLSPRSLATFYAGLLGVPDRKLDTVERVELDLADDELPNHLAFQQAEFTATRWPDPAYPAQLHVDWRFPDGSGAARERAGELGAIPLHGPTYADPAGHPFCL